MQDLHVILWIRSIGKRIFNGNCKICGDLNKHEFFLIWCMLVKLLLISYNMVSGEETYVTLLSLLVMVLGTINQNAHSLISCQDIRHSIEAE